MGANVGRDLRILLTTIVCLTCLRLNDDNRFNKKPSQIEMNDQLYLPKDALHSLLASMDQPAHSHVSQGQRRNRHHQ